MSTIGSYIGFHLVEMPRTVRRDVSTIQMFVKLANDFNADISKWDTPQVTIKQSTFNWWNSGHVMAKNLTWSVVFFKVACSISLGIRRNVQRVIVAFSVIFRTIGLYIARAPVQED